MIAVLALAAAAAAHSNAGHWEASSPELQLVGSYETGFYELDDNAFAWPLPNALVVVRRQR